MGRWVVVVFCVAGWCWWASDLLCASRGVFWCRLCVDRFAMLRALIGSMAGIFSPCSRDTDGRWSLTGASCGPCAMVGHFVVAGGPPFLLHAQQMRIKAGRLCLVPGVAHSMASGSTCCYCVRVLALLCKACGSRHYAPIALHVMVSGGSELYSPVRVLATVLPASP